MLKELRPTVEALVRRHGSVNHDLAASRDDLSRIDHRLKLR